VNNKNYAKALKTTQDRVEDLLKEYPELRNADNKTIVFFYWKVYDDLDLTMWIPQLTDTETIRRAKQLLVAKYPEKFGTTDPKVQEEKDSKEAQYHLATITE
jgi:hypothetical protein